MKIEIKVTSVRVFRHNAKLYKQAGSHPDSSGADIFCPCPRHLLILSFTSYAICVNAVLGLGRIPFYPKTALVYIVNANSFLKTNKSAICLTLLINVA